MRTCLAWMLLLIIGAGSLGGCSTYDRRFAYDPPIATVPVEDEGLVSGAEAVDMPASGGGGGGEVRTLASIIGIRNEDRDAGLPHSVEVRLRVENDGPHPVRFLPEGLSLVAANLEDFPPPIIRPAGPLEVAPGSQATITAYFPLSPRHPAPPLDLTGLNLGWRLAIADTAINEQASFTRRPTRYSHPHHSAGIGYYGGSRRSSIGIGISFGW